MRGSTQTDGMPTKPAKRELLIDVDKPPSKPIEWIPFTYPDPVKALKDTMKKFPKMTQSEARLLLIYQGTATCSAVSQGSDGGGRCQKYIDGLRKHGKM
jgi:hypothetical protein